MKRFNMKDEEFICENCNNKVSKLNYSARGHCNICLYSKHVDINPGDRLNECKGLLEPIAIEKFRDSYKIIYKEGNYTEEEIKELLIELSNLGPKQIILTGISFKDNELGVMSYNKETNKFFTYFREKIPVKYHGTGDIFASTLVGAILNENSLEESLKIAVDYVWETINDTYKEKKEDAYGVNFENKIPYLINRLKI